MSARLLFIALFSFQLLAIVKEGFAGNEKAQPVIISTEISGGDLQFLVTATEQGLLQANLGALAATRAQSSEVKAFGQGLVKIYATQNEQIKLIAIKKGLAVPSGLNATQSASAEKLEKLKGLKFDKVYMETVVQEQQDYAAIVERAMQSHDPDIKSYATGLLPAIKEQVALVRNLTGTSSHSGPSPRFRIDPALPGK